MAMNELADQPLRLPEEPVLLHWWRLFRWFMNLRAVPRWHERSARFLTRLFRRWFYDSLTRTGKIIAIASLLIFLFSYSDTSNFLLTTSAMGMALMGWSLLLGYLYRPRISITRTLPNYAVAGQAVVSQVTLANTGKRSLYNFCAREMVVPFGRWPREWDRFHHEILRPGQSVTVPVEFTPLKRGVLQLSGIVVQSYFPFFLTRSTCRVDAPARINVLPATLPVTIPALRHLAEQASKKLTLGRDNSRKGPSLEYAYSRQYQTGDPLRRLDQRASSRRGQPMSKVFEGAEEIRRDRVYLLIDVSLEGFERWQPRPHNRSALNQRLALAVEIGLSAQTEGFSLAAAAFGRQWHELESPVDFYARIAACDPTRACTETNRSLPGAVLAEDGVHVLVVGRWTEEARHRVERWQKQGILVIVFLLAEAPGHRGTLPSGIQFVEITLPEQSWRERQQEAWLV